MLRIRLTRTGKTNRPSYRIVVAEHTSPIKGKFIEVLGFYNPIENPKQLEFKEDRIKYWISVGAQPTDTVASLLKSKGMADMDKYIAPRDKKRKGKGPEEEAPTTPPASSPPAATPAPAEDKHVEESSATPPEEVVEPVEAKKEAEVAPEPATAEESKEEAPAEEALEPEVASEEKPAAEAESADQPATEEAPAEEEDKKDAEAA
ncbi:30S ribosomal protein S16 [Candidatus Peregrinibacteria bacterium CG22_combo_CG10-13_8_21_14_all_44_10]|nr:MAG: 30S ribosomal protein S16 [Candidatus Peregrinibacteria bacterium CG2_30_44_17]PIP66592.1 MAG: 30S ribosomal protein S16 [Candidatus Peregrinibacteria bacterium CG22_combo_CG10-13_8_21_14_all_44_10]PIS03671.1 MAG: 30S ribosomal protein S16 [Candidatus Peregrinibacteria bacterium CG10_big_fil_rev_8_21_14_0_10_44_7]PIX80521.1 MAG: 30S ribosomal protein S16 [Candidatus Peregrinibacteria bacterium CG_4_10_14_3_um_filter_44_21]PJB89300.1 MAG: 30S ribosomal protein S16 [Candidatus Peregriniba